MTLRIEKNVPLDQHTTLQVGGVADHFAVVHTDEELRAALQFASQTAAPPLILGGGSNVLISEAGYRGLVIKMEKKGVLFSEKEDGSVWVEAAAGEEWDSFVAAIVERRLSGLENLSGVPGTVGAAPVQNINCYGASVADVIESVAVMDSQTGEVRSLSNAACQFGYRDSIFKRPAGANLIVTAVTFRLAPAGRVNLAYRSASQSIARYFTEQGVSEPTVADVRQAILHVRGNIGMLAGQYRSAGSFFKNTVVSTAEFTHILDTVQKKFPDQNKEFSPWHWELPDGSVKISTAFLLECTPYNKTAFAGKLWHNTVGISPVHSLSLVTDPGATSQDVITFAAEIVATVQKAFGVEIESEVVVIK